MGTVSRKRTSHEAGPRAEANCDRAGAGERNGRRDVLFEDAIDHARLAPVAYGNRASAFEMHGLHRVLTEDAVLDGGAAGFAQDGAAVVVSECAADREALQ